MQCGFGACHASDVKASPDHQRIVLFKARLNTMYCGSHSVYLERLPSDKSPRLSHSDNRGSPKEYPPRNSSRPSSPTFPRQDSLSRQSSAWLSNVQLQSYNNGTTIYVIDVQDSNLDINQVYSFNTLKKLDVKEISLDQADYACDCLVFCYEYINFLKDHGIKFPYSDLFLLYNAPNLENAFWNGSYLTFGEGIKNKSKPFVSSCIVGHELTHALIQASCNLDYQGQSGALNESYADIFGVMFEFYILNKARVNNIWPEIGDELYHDGSSMRSFENPELCGQPTSIRSMYKGNEDHGGVHINSGIINHCFYKMQLVKDRKTIFDIFLKVFFKLNSKTNFSQFKMILLKYVYDSFELVSIVESIL
jgi:Zn-dependent metalloprotease